MPTRSTKAVERIGTVTLPDGEAWLGQDGVWRAEPSILADYLNAAHSPYAGGHSATHGFGFFAIRQAAEQLKGTATFPLSSDA